MKKQFTFILALAMLMIMLAGCSGNTTARDFWSELHPEHRQLQMTATVGGWMKRSPSAILMCSLRRLQLILRWRTLENTWSSSPTAGLP